MKKEHWSTLSHLKERMELIKEKPGLLQNSDIKLVYDFAGKLASKEYLGGFIQGIVLFGSVMREEATKTSDIDVLVIIDDVSNNINSEMAGAYSLSVGQLLAKLNAYEKVHVTTLGLIRFWDGVRNGDPVVMSILRSGKAIVDTGFFTPLKAMLDRGMIKPSREAVISHLHMADSLLRNQVNYFNRSVSDFYWAVIDAAHSLIMHAGEETTHPREVSKLFRKVSKQYKLDSRLYLTIDKFYKLMKGLSGGKKFTGRQVDDLKKRAERFVSAVKKVIDA